MAKGKRQGDRGDRDLVKGKHVESVEELAKRKALGVLGTWRKGKH